MNYVQNIRRYYDVLVWNEEQFIAMNEQTDDNVSPAEFAVTVIPPLL